MSNYTWEYIQKNQKETKRLLGINYDQLEQLIEYALVLHEQKEQEKEKQKVRIIKSGGGRESKIEKPEQIILTLVYLRHHLTFQLLGLMFQVSESTAHQIFHYWQQILSSALPCSLLEQVKKFDGNLPEIVETLTDYELIVDTEEQPIERDLSYEEQKKYYSGKQKDHTFKSQIISLPKAKDIVDVVAGEPGPKSDIKICRETLSKFSKNQKFSGDKAYIGEEQIKTPAKKPRGGELTQSQKETNKEISSERVFVEHLIRIIKIFRIMQERFRLSKSKYKSIFFTICGLVRLRINALFIEVVNSSEIDKEIEIILSHSFNMKLDL
jgi:DDE superfamily endonuclease/Helix-turn-helix of DDE superfamily endonuclease